MTGIQEISESSLQYLPAIYQEDAFLREFLGPFEDVLRGFSDLLWDVDRYFSPASTDVDFLPWLSTWVALLLDEEWDEARRRELIGEAVQLYRSRGTVEGLKRYLEIYTGYEPDIREWRWPGGMQIGVASQIGGPAATGQGLPARIPVPMDSNAPGGDTYQTTVSHFAASRQRRDYYVVHLFEEDKLVYYRVHDVTRVDRGEDAGGRFVEIERAADGTVVRYQPASISRRDGVFDSLYTLRLEVETNGTQAIEYQYQGNTWLVDEVAGQPYQFLVHVRVPADHVVDRHEIGKIRSIIELEKPAHTTYYLKVTPVVSVHALQPMQLGVRGRCEIGVHSVMG